MVLCLVISETEAGKATRELKSTYLGSEYLLSHMHTFLLGRYVLYSIFSGIG